MFNSNIEIVMDMFLVCLTCLLVSVVDGQRYNRSALQEKYPGFGTDWIVMQDDSGEAMIGYFQNPAGESRLSFSPDPEDAVFFFLFTRDRPQGIEVKSLKDLEGTFNSSKPTKFVTHGWMSGGQRDSSVSIKNGFLKKYDANVFIVDWSKIAGNIVYPIPMQATSGVGEFYAKFLNNLQNLGADPKTFHLVGHSLGAHVSGFAARRIKKNKVGRVTALDPALPGFSMGFVEGGRLSKTDAIFVDVIHTCAGFLGIQEPLGHVDYYPNGGEPPQPGCGSIVEMIEACSHGRSWKFFAESLTSSLPFLGYRCNSFDEFLKTKECRDEGVPMGDPTPFTARGVFYLKTDAKAPFVQYLTDDNEI